MSSSHYLKLSAAHGLFVPRFIKYFLPRPDRHRQPVLFGGNGAAPVGGCKHIEYIPTLPLTQILDQYRVRW